MSYTIKQGRPKDIRSAINLDRFEYLSVPKKILVGLVDREKTYKEWLEKALEADGSESEESKRLYSLCFLHRHAKEKGEITLYASGSLARLQIAKVSEFLKEHGSFMDSVMPYLFNDVVHMSDKVAV